MAGQQLLLQVVAILHLTDEKGAKEAAPLVHVHSSGVGHCHKEPVARAQRVQSPLVGGVQGEVGVPGPAGSAAGLHQQDRDGVGAHLWEITEENKYEAEIKLKNSFNFYIERKKILYIF